MYLGTPSYVPKLFPRFLVYIGLQRLTFLLWMKLSHWRNLCVNELAGFGFVAAQKPSEKCCEEGADVSE